MPVGKVDEEILHKTVRAATKLVKSFMNFWYRTFISKSVAKNKLMIDER